MDAEVTLCLGNPYIMVIQKIVHHPHNSNMSNYKNKKDPKNGGLVATEELGPTDGMNDNIKMMVHEIRNPLTAISLAGQSIENAAAHTDPSLVAYTEIIAKNISRIEEILKGLLCPKNKTSELVPTDICDIIEDSLGRADDRIFLKKIRVIKSYGFGLMVHADAEKLSIVFLNIIVNAVEAVKEKGKIWITVYRAKDEINVIFKDNGAGMDKGVANHMFDRNFSGKPKGLGVGLTYVKEILEQHSASIRVTSEPGAGTSVVITFKLYQYQ